MTPSSVLLVTPRWTRDGGVGAHVQASAAALAAAGLRVAVLAARVDEDSELEGVDVHSAPALFDARAPMDARLGDGPRLGAEVIHLHQVDEPDVVAALRASAPVISSAHAYPACTAGVHYFRPGEECGRAHGPGCVPNLLLRGCAHTANPTGLPGRYATATRALAALRASDLAIAYSRAVEAHLAVNGISRRALVPLFATIAPHSGSGHEQRRRVVYAGRVVKPKGVEVLLRAAPEVDSEFIVCGEGRLLGRMRTLAARLGVAGRVRFTGWLGAEELAGELAEASVVALPSIWPEPFGLVGIEAFAAGRPVVASATGGVTDWLQHGVNGLGVPPGDAHALAGALSELLADPARQTRMGRAGRELVSEHFSRAAHVAALLRAYEAARSGWAPVAAAAA
jgi:glycosyltransferase involved in cell wall biosynthesis